MCSLKTIDNELLFKKRQENGVLIAAHRGTSGGNIIQNTISAYENSLIHGADIIESDVIQTTDGDFFVFHNGQELGLLGVNKDIRTMSTKEVLSYNLMNSMQEKVGEKVNRLDDMLEHFKGKCLINIDRSWFYWKDLINKLDGHNMFDQIILKGPPSHAELQMLKDSNSKLMYMTIIREEKQLEFVKEYQLNLIGAEVIFKTEDTIFSSDEFIEQMHKDNLLLWVNALTLNDTAILSASHDDNHAILKNMDEAWGWLINKKFDIIQTDWPLLLKQYINEKNRRIIL